MKYIKYILVFAVGFWFGYWLSYQARPDDEVAERQIQAQQAYIAELKNCIRNIGETQQQLIDVGFKDVVIEGEPNEVTVDYIWGPITERAYGNYMAARSMARMAGDKK